MDRVLRCTKVGWARLWLVDLKIPWGWLCFTWRKDQLLPRIEWL